MCDGMERLNSFTFNGWSDQIPIDPLVLAEAGFYLSKNRREIDQVVCFSCGIRIARWQEGDDPFKEHQRINPRCDFIMGYNVGNIPLCRTSDGDPIRGSKEHRRLERGADLCGGPRLFEELRKKGCKQIRKRDGVWQCRVIPPEAEWETMEMDEEGIPI